MGKMIKHIWKYLTSPTYRSWVDFCSLEENLNRQMKLIEDNLRLATYPMFYYKNGKIKKLTPPDK
jgi:hypothetical protein